MQDTPAEDFPELPPSLKLLRLLVFILTGVMIAGFIILMALIVTRLSGKDVTLPESVTLPDGTRATAFTQAGDWWAVVTDDQRILIFDRATGALKQTVQID